MSNFGLTTDEMNFLIANVKASDRVFEYGTGETTAMFAQRCRYVTAVEHQPARAAEAIICASYMSRTNVSILSIQPDFPYVEGTEDDGDLATFKRYVESCDGRVDVCLIDGRARVECARFILERAPYGPHPELKVFLHDIDRPALQPIFTDTVVDGVVTAEAMFFLESKVGRLALLRPFNK